MKCVVAGTGYKNPDGSSRANIIRKHCRENKPVMLVREPENKYDPHAIAVHIQTSWIFGLFKSYKQIGYVKSKRAKKFAEELDEGKKLSAYVFSFYAPSHRDHPRVSLEITRQ